ncbi:MAG: hypothetical protein ABWZ26_02900 [Candidatus Nanopelagicales bacterium]
MTVLGLLLVLAAAGLTIWLVWENTQDASLTLGSASLDEISVGGVFLAGVATALLFALGWWLLMNGARRARVRRAEVKRLRRERDEAHTELDRTREHEEAMADRELADRERDSAPSDRT